MTSNDFNKAFKSLNEALCEADFDLTTSSADEIRNYLNDDEKDNDVSIYDIDADCEEELDSDNVGKIILQCPCCQSLIMKPAEDIELPEECDEDTECVVNTLDECPTCFHEGGFKIIGKVAPYEEVTVEIEKKDSEEDSDETIDKDETDTSEVDKDNIKSSEPSEESLKIAEEILTNIGIECEDCQEKLASAIDAIGEDAVKELIEIGATSAMEDEEDTLDTDTEDTDTKDEKEIEESLEECGGRIPAFMKKKSNTSESFEKEEYLCDTDIKDDKEKDEETEKNESYSSDSMEADFKKFIDKWGDCIGDAENLLDLWKDHGLNDKEECKKTSESLEEDADEINAILSTDKNESLDEIFGLSKAEKEEKARYEKTKAFEKECRSRDSYPWWTVKMSDGLTMQSRGKDAEDAMDWCTRYEEDRSGSHAISAKPFKGNSNESMTEGLNDVLLETDTDKISIHAEAKNNGDEMIAPLDFQAANEIVDAQPEAEEDTEYLDNVETEEEPVEDIEGEPLQDEVADIDIDDVDEEAFDSLGESFFTSSYSNVKGYKTQSIRESNNKIICEGLITFESGNQRPTQFIVEGDSISNDGHCSMLIENAQLTPGKKAIKMAGKIEGKKLIPESLTYNYEHNGIQLSGTVNKH